MNAHRIAIVGSPGSGKSTLSRKLAKILKLPLHHLDCLFWLPGWVQKPRSEFNALHDELLDEEQWIIDGNYGRTQEKRFEKADTIIFFDFPTLFCLFRIIKRQVFQRNKPRPDITVGCEEKLEIEFLKYIIQFRKTRRLDTLIRLKNLPKMNIFRLISPRSVTRFLDNLLVEIKL